MEARHARAASLLASSDAIASARRRRVVESSRVEDGIETSRRVETYDTMYGTWSCFTIEYERKRPFLRTL